jgi:hypothetical protein
MSPHHILSLADKMASALEAKGIPTGDLYRGITHDAWVRARAVLLEALEAQAAEIAKLTAERDALLAALDLYADPVFYHGCAFMFDRPTGGFDEDFGPNEDYDYDKPGKLARETLDAIDAARAQEKQK